jgi:hypothetical protein
MAAAVLTAISPQPINPSRNRSMRTPLLYVVSVFRRLRFRWRHP